MREPRDFKQLGDAYDRAMRGPFRFVFGPLTAVALKAMPGLNLGRLLGEAASVLEVGCGQGYLLEKAQRDLASRTTVGVDLSAVMLEIAGQRLLRNGKTQDIQLVQGEATTLPFEDCAFDVVLSMGMMEHLDNELLIKFMGEARRLLKPGGRFLASTFSPKSPAVALTRGPGWIRRRLPAYGRTLVGRSSEELCGHAREAGFVTADERRLGLLYTGVLARRG